MKSFSKAEWIVIGYIFHFNCQESKRKQKTDNLWIKCR